MTYILYFWYDELDESLLKKKEMQMIKRKMKGFTLVETVIVIAVIAILSSILIPTFGNVIKDANETKYKSEAANAVREYCYQSGKTEYKTALVLYFKGGKADSLETATRAYLANGANIGDCLTAVPDGADALITVGSTDNTFDLMQGVEIFDGHDVDDTERFVPFDTVNQLYWISDNVALAILIK